MAGLCAGMRLARAGADVKILEATKHIGGRSLTLRNGDSYREWDWNHPTIVKFEQVDDVAPNSPDNYLNAGPGRIPQHHERLIDYCKELHVKLQPYLFYDAANLMQNDSWNGGKPVQLRRLKNDLRGHLSEMMAKVQNQGALDKLVDPSEVDAFLGMLQHFGQLSAEDAALVYRGSATIGYPRAGFRVQPGNVKTPGRPWPTLSLDEVLNSDFWNSEMFNNLEYFWQASLMQPANGMDMIVKGFQRAPISDQGKTVDSLITSGEPVTSIDVVRDKVTVVTGKGRIEGIDYVVATLSAPLLAQLGGNFLNPTVKQILSSVYITPACKVGWQGRSRFWEDEDRIYGGISWTKDIINQIWYPSYSFNSPTGVLTGAYNRAADATEFQELSRSERIEAALAGGEKLHPGFREKVFADNGVTIAWAKMPYQAGGWANDTFKTQPKVFTDMANADPINSKVFVAGDWFSYWPGWQIGALDSAHMATDMIHRKSTNRG
ncbi:MAG: FAD-dependent oxidoreductase [bacterium]|nr:FAD-dependent oxidoreductase [bacterium]